MRVKCLHGFFIFQETAVGQISDFMALTGVSLTPWRDFYTFEDIELAPNYSLKGKALLDTTATVTFEGEPWDVFEANGLVYNFVSGLIVPIASISQVTEVLAAGNRLISPGLILPGSLTDDGDRVKAYSAWYSRTTQRWNYSEVEFV